MLENKFFLVNLTTILNYIKCENEYQILVTILKAQKLKGYDLAACLQK